MHTYGAFEAKTHLGQILDEVEQGKSVVISRHGRVIAILKPYTQAEENENRALKAIRAIKTMRKNVKLGAKHSIKDLIEEGRR